ncbi:TetR/AcrR family transcriptional regulator [Terracoccus sp. 273MFTsu3.1]|uniref:TetR/AcrR family transcriptional regulator n=1 Tax=Terracoccus sp. 273MFTsu3.1 TaxID=1172188 RepID=UPI0003A1835B|nr:TetR/AcrR family transcriptional regulator [Terracoccus sp. 273MFTsu3.1]
MTTTRGGSHAPSTRAPLSRDRVLDGAMRVADDGGLGALTIRAVAEQLGTKPMSIYHYVGGKEEIIDGIVDQVFGEMDLPATEGNWRVEMHRRCSSARTVLRRHPWAIPLLQSRTRPGPATLSHLDAVIGCLRGAGFSLELTAHAYALIDSYVYGFAMSEASLPINGPETVGEVAESMMLEYLAADYPNLLEFTTGHVLQPGYDFGLEFDYGLDLVLDALEARVSRPKATRTP